VNIPNFWKRVPEIIENKDISVFVYFDILNKLSLFYLIISYDIIILSKFFINLLTATIVVTVS
jgi:hypothetical protein